MVAATVAATLLLPQVSCKLEDVFNKIEFTFNDNSNSKTKWTDEKKKKNYVRFDGAIGADNKTKQNKIKNNLREKRRNQTRKKKKTIGRQRKSECWRGDAHIVLTINNVR